MHSVYKFVSTVIREINPATLSGAIDVIVVEQPNGDLACSPFHVRFGKFAVLRPQEKKVEVTVNNRPVDFPMKVGEAGEAFFIFETEDEVPKELQTSPLAGPSKPSPSEEEPDFFDLSKSGNYRSKTDPIEEDNDSTPSHPQVEHSPDEMKLDSHDQEKSINKFQNGIEENTPKTNGIDSPTTDKIYDDDDVPDSPSFLEKKMRGIADLEAQLEKSVLALDNDKKNQFYAAEVFADEKTIVEDVAIERTQIEAVDNGQGQIDTTDDQNQTGIVVNEQNHENVAVFEQSHVSGMTNENRSAIDKDQNALGEGNEKIGDDQNNVEEEEAPVANRNHVASISQEHQKWEKPEGPFSDTELDDTRKPENLLERRISRTSPLSDTELEKLSTDPQEWSWGWGDLPVRTSQKLEKWRDDTDEKGWQATQNNEADEKSHTEVGGKRYNIQMSLCGNEEAFGRDKKTDDELFRKNEITYEHFCENPQILNVKALVVKYENRYYNWATAAPMIVSLMVYKKPLPESTISSLSSTLSPSERRRYSFGWFFRGGSQSSGDKKPKIDEERHDIDLEKQMQEIQDEKTTHYAKTLRLTSDQLKSLNLRKGVNTMSFSVTSSYQGKATCVARLFFWDYNAQIIISDIDGTITKSDALGHVFTMIGRDWTHSGVARLYTDIRNNGYEILYLTSRAIGQADYTRDYLRKVEQDKYQLPDGPVIMSPDRLLKALHREVIIRRPELFKVACLNDIKKLFGDRKPFFAGFGNRITDAFSYRSMGVPSSRIFTIDSEGTVMLELLLGYKSSYIDLRELVDQMFPHIGGEKWDTEYNDWNYWKTPLPKIELPPELFADKPTSPSPESQANNSSNPLETPTVLPPNFEGKSKRRGGRRKRSPYINGDFDMPGKMDIDNVEDEEYDEVQDGDDEGSEEGSGEDESDVPTDIDLTGVPY